MNVNLSYTKDITNNILLNVSGNEYQAVPDGDIIDGNKTLNIYYRNTNRLTYILFLYHNSPYSSYIDVYNRNIFNSNITLKDIVSTIMFQDELVKRYSVDEDDNKLKINFTSNDKCINANALVYKIYKKKLNNNKDNNKDNDEDSDDN